MKVLVCIDAQNFYSSDEKLNERISKFISKQRNKGYTIITTRDEAEYKDGEPFMMPPVILDAIDLDEDYCICKTTPGSFDLVNLLYSLDDSKNVIDTIEVCGLNDRAILVNTLLFKTAFPEADIIVFEDLCPETISETLLSWVGENGVFIGYSASGCDECELKETCEAANDYN